MVRSLTIKAAGALAVTGQTRHACRRLKEHVHPGWRQLQPLWGYSVVEAREIVDLLVGGQYPVAPPARSFGEIPKYCYAKAEAVGSNPTSRMRE